MTGLVWARSSRGAALLLVVALGSCTAGCVSPRERAADEAAVTFLAAAQADPSQACDLLSESTREKLEDSAGQSCDAALAQLSWDSDEGHTTATVQGRQAIVRVGDGAVFLSLFDVGWLVVAANCTRTSGDIEVPWDCTITGR